MQRMKLWESNTPLYQAENQLPEPYMDIYLSQNAKPGAPFVIVCPGGGYLMLAQDHEGKQIAEKLNENGIHAGVLIYRYHPYHYPVMQYDINRAVRLMRFHAKDFGVDETKIGVMGFSAGGNLAALGLTRYDLGMETGDEIDLISCRPDFGILCYAVISLHEELTHPDTRNVLFGGDADYAHMVELLSPEDHVTKDTPPMFLWHSAEDRCVIPQNTLHMAIALQQNDIPYELHIFPRSPHGIGMGDENNKDQHHAGQWMELLLRWLKDYYIN